MVGSSLTQLTAEISSSEDALCEQHLVLVLPNDFKLNVRLVDPVILLLLASGTTWGDG